MLRVLKYLVITLIGVAGIAVALVWIALQIRPSIEDTGLPTAAIAMTASSDAGVTVRWLGVATLLIDDGETQLLTDGFFSRPSLSDLILQRPIAPDDLRIREQIRRYNLTRLAAVIPVHSHYDHAMDSGAVAVMTGATVFGSESSANAARGAGVDEASIIVAGAGRTHQFGKFAVELRRSRHAPIGLDGQPPYPGVIDAPLRMPAPANAWREGGSYSIIIRHPNGSLLVQGSAGFTPGLLDDVDVDAAFLSITGLGKLGHDYANGYWRESVEASKAEAAYLIHWDDFTLPYGELQPFPTLIENLERTAGWLQQFALSTGREARGKTGRSTEIAFLPFGEAIDISPGNVTTP